MSLWPMSVPTTMVSISEARKHRGSRADTRSYSHPDLFGLHIEDCQRSRSRARASVLLCRHLTRDRNRPSFTRFLGQCAHILTLGADVHASNSTLFLTRLLFVRVAALVVSPAIKVI